MWATTKRLKWKKNGYPVREGFSVFLVRIYGIPNLASLLQQAEATACIDGPSNKMHSPQSNVTKECARIPRQLILALMDRRARVGVYNIEITYFSNITFT